MDMNSGGCVCLILRHPEDTCHMEIRTINPGGRNKGFTSKVQSTEERRSVQPPKHRGCDKKHEYSSPKNVNGVNEYIYLLRVFAHKLK